MKYSTNIKDNASHGITNGVNICRNAVAGTIGGAGRNVIIRQEYYPYYISTKDAFSIIQSIRCEDALEKQAVDMLRDATDSMNKIARDGRTAMVILTDAILQEVKTKGLDPIQVEKEINELLPLIEKEIDKQTKQITVEEVEAVATTASNSTRIGKLLGEVYKKQGKECLINHIEGSGTLEDYVIYRDGVNFKGARLFAEAFVHDLDAKEDKRAEKRAIYKNPVVLVTARDINRLEDIDPFITRMVREGKKDLVIFADKVAGDVQTQLVNTHKNGVLNICLIKAPIVWKDLIFQDFAKVTGATVVDDSTGVTWKNLEMKHLGTCDKIVVDMEEVLINPSIDISEHIKDLRARGDDDSMRRVFWLTTKTATVRLGAINEGELSNLRLAAQDAVYSSQAALQHGIVPGGGVALLNVAVDTDKLPQFLTNVLLAPFYQILDNANLNEDGTKAGMGGTMGYDAKTGKLVDMFKAGIVDSSLVVKNSIRNAIGIASVVLKTDKLIDLPKMTSEELQMQMLQAQRRPY